MNITYKILYNDAVAMTGGQPHDGPLSPLSIINQVRAEGVQKITVVTDEPEKYEGVPLPSNVPVHHREKLDEIQREFRDAPGCTIVVYTTRPAPPRNVVVARSANSPTRQARGDQRGGVRRLRRLRR